MAKSELDSIQEVGKNARNQLIQDLKLEGIVVTETFACSRYGEIKQGYETVSASTERIYRLDIPKFVDQDTMLHAFILAFHLGAFNYEKKFNNLQGFKQEWHQAISDYNFKRYKQAWVFAESWIDTWLQSNYSENDVYLMRSLLNAELQKAKKLTRVKSLTNVVLIESVEGLFKYIVRPISYAYIVSVFLWFLLNNGIPPFHLMEASNSLRPSDFVLIFFLIWPFILVFKLFCSFYRQEPVQRDEPFLITMKTKLDVADEIRL